MEIRRVYEYALQREREGKRFFEQHAESMSHAVAQQAFRQLAQEEEAHIRFIERLLAQGTDPAPEVPGPESGQEPGFFELRALQEHVDQSVIEAMVPDLAVLRMAYLIERDFVEFYESAAERADGAARQALSDLAAWERGHEQLFRRLHDQAFEAYAHMPWGG
jgi:rubrerythrin